MPSDNNELRIAAIGRGLRGGLVDLAHDPANGVRVVALAALEDEALAQFREKYGDEAHTTKDYRDILKRDDTDAVFVLSPDYLHEEHAVAALEAGKAVYLEKPMAITTASCDRILLAARRTGSKLYLGHNMRHFAVVLKMKELIDSGAIGEVKAAWCRHFVSYGGDAYFKDWHADRTTATGLLLQKGAHDIDIIHWLCGGYSKRVTAMGGLVVYGQITDHRTPDTPPDISWSFDNWPPLSQKGLNPVVDVEDVSMMLMQLDNGVFASYQQCHFTPDAWRNYTVIGTEGRVENFGDAPGESVVRLWNKRSHYKPEGDHEFAIPKAEGTHGGADPLIVEEFIGYVKGTRAPTTSPVAARYAVAAGCAATESLRNGCAPVEVPPLPVDVV